MIDYTEVGIAVLVQGATGIAIVATIRTNLKNLAGWVSKIDNRLVETDRVARELKGHVEALPCSTCRMVE